MAKRNYGIDLLRIIAMIFVVIQHIMINGGVINSASKLLTLNICWIIEIIAFVAIDCYGIISGYVGYREKEKENRFSRIIDLWMQVVFYGIIAFIVFKPIFADKIAFSQLIKSFFPIIFDQYWFFSAYFVLFIFMPFLNKICYSMTKHELEKNLIVVIVLFSFVSTFVSPISDIFKMSSGYSYIWLIVCYLIGAWIRKNDIVNSIKSSTAIITAIICFLLVWLFKIPMPLITNKLLGFTAGTDFLMAYNSPVYIIAAFMLFVLFARININKSFANIIRFLAPSAFSVYLIHMQPIIKNMYIVDRFKFIADINWCLIPFVVIGIALIVFTISILIDKCRIFIFKITRINKFNNYLGLKVNSILDKISKNLF